MEKKTCGEHGKGMLEKLERDTFCPAFTDRHPAGVSHELCHGRCQLKRKGSLRSVAHGQSVEFTPAGSNDHPQLGSFGEGLQQGASVSPKSLGFISLGQVKVQQLVFQGDHPRCFWWSINRPKHSSFSILALEMNILPMPLKLLWFCGKRQASLMADPVGAGYAEREKAKIGFAGPSELRA